MHLLVENKFPEFAEVKNNYCKTFVAFVEAPPFEKKVDVFSFLLFTLLLNKHNHRKSLINTIKNCSFCLVVMLVYRL